MFFPNSNGPGSADECNGCGDQEGGSEVAEAVSQESGDDGPRDLSRTEEECNESERRGRQSRARHIPACRRHNRGNAPG